ncbi:hypothetical protein PSENEW3_00006164 [Picochlorum sp. SENEW3]|nr:hypothetical protein PSENEW3_00006164 [Picochlorum sp. SENEW3]
MASNWRETTVVVCCLVLAQVYLFSPPVVEGQYAAQIGCLNATCKAKLSALLDRYEYAVDSVNGCDVECQYNCYEVLEEALQSTSGTHCPPVDNVTACFGLYGNEWVELAEECPLFNIKEQSEAEAEAESEEEEAEAPSSEEAESEEEEAEAPSSQEEEAEAENDDATGTTSRRLMEEEAEAESEEEEAEAPSSQEEEAEAEAEATGEEAEAEAEATSEEAEAEAEATGDEAEAEAEGECSSSSGGEGEGEGEGEADFVGKGCFPEFETLTDFKVYTEGAYYAAVWNKPTNTVGVILSVFFWLGLAGMGVYLGRK